MILYVESHADSKAMGEGLKCCRIFSGEDLHRMGGGLIFNIAGHPREGLQYNTRGICVSQIRVIFFYR